MTEVSSASILDRVRLDVERNALRARNGIRLAAGLLTTQARHDPEGCGVATRPV